MAAAGALTFRAMTSAFWDRDLQSDTMRWNDGMEMEALLGSVSA